MIEQVHFDVRWVIRCNPVQLISPNRRVVTVPMMQGKTSNFPDFSELRVSDAKIFKVAYAVMEGASAPKKRCFHLMHQDTGHCASDSRGRHKAKQARALRRFQCVNCIPVKLGC